MINIIQMMGFIMLIIHVYTTSQDLITFVPGYDSTYPGRTFSGYLKTSNPKKLIHYVLSQSIKGQSNNDPLVIWLNGGPGCSSMLGFLQQIGPFYLKDGEDYKKGDLLQRNQWSWNNISNLLFFQSPAGVGYSIYQQDQWTFNDSQTADDSLQALLSFYQKFPQFADRQLWLTGESYAGKYVPDLGVRIHQHNLVKGNVHIDFRGVMVGNGVMNFMKYDLPISQVQYMISHDFVDPQLQHYWKHSCLVDPSSAGCGFFSKRFQQQTLEINPYSNIYSLDVYGYCYYNDTFLDKRTFNFQTQESILRRIKKFKGSLSQKNRGKNGALCAFFDGVYNYFRQNQQIFVGNKTMIWNGPCADNVSQNYNIDMRGSIEQYRKLLQNYDVILYNGDWDDVVPYTDTLSNIPDLYISTTSKYQPWYTQDGQHAGFYQNYQGLLFSIIKGASHQVPQSKRAASYHLFNQTLNAHKK